MKDIRFDEGLIAVREGQDPDEGVKRHFHVYDFEVQNAFRVTRRNWICYKSKTDIHSEILATSLWGINLG